MPLYDRLIGRDDAGDPVPLLGVHVFMAAVGEYTRGKITQQDIVGYYGLDAGETAELATLLAKVVPAPDQVALGGFATLTNVGAAYDATGPARGLGIVRMEAAGVSAIEFGVRYDKVGTGTLSWQLWDEDTAAEVVRVDDAAAAGANKSGVATKVYTPPLAAGVHTLRVRCKSTVAADDPVYLGASLRITRTDLLVSGVLHEVLLLGEAGAPPYNTPTEVKARLGV